jgi:O-succinylbenzoic acid--CoA ligase
MKRSPRSRGRNFKSQTLNFNLERGNTALIEAEAILKAAFWADGDPIPFQTSGSTGAAKQIVLTKEALLLSAKAVNAWLRVDPSSVWGLALPLHHVGGFGVAARAYAAGCGLAVYGGKWDSARFTEWIAEKRVTHVSLVPTQIHDLLAAGLQAPACLAAVVVGGGKLTAEAGQAAREKGWPVLASYGMTEACSQIATQSPELLGLPYVDAPLEILPIWEAGETPEGLLRIKGAALFTGTIEQGVFRRREGDWFTTSDRAAVNGNTLTPQGRADSRVKVMGELIDVEAVEKRFLEHAGGTVREGTFAVIPIPDARREHALIAVFEGHCPEETLAAYQSQAPGTERFVRWIAMETFPRTDLGKLRREDLRRMYVE